MRLFKIAVYELKKLVSHGYVRVLFVLLFSANLLSVWFFCNEYLAVEKDTSEYGYTRDDVKLVHEMRYEDPEWFLAEYERITNEAYASWDSPMPESIYTNCDLYVFENVYRNVYAADRYRETITDTVEEAKLMLHISSMYTDAPFDDSLEYQEHVIERYTYLLENTEQYEGHAFGWSTYFSYTAVSLILFLWTAIIAVSVFYEHINTGFIFISRTSRHGRAMTAFAKLLVMTVAVILSVFVFLLSTMLIIELRIGFTGWNSPIQLLQLGNYFPSSTDYTFVPLKLTVSGYALVNALLKIVVMIAFAAFTALCAMLFNQTVGYITAIALFVVQYFASRPGGLTTSQWSSVNMVSLCRDDIFLTRLREVTLFGHSVDLFPIVIILLLLATLLISIFIFVRFIYRRGAVKQGTRLYNYIKNFIQSKVHKFVLPKRRSYPVGLWKYEYRKNRSIFWLYGVLAIIMYFVNVDYYIPPDSAYDRMYREAMEIYEGEYSEEKAEEIIRIRDEYQVIVDQYEHYYNAYRSGEVSIYELNTYYDNFKIAQGRLPVYKDLADTSIYLQNVRGGWYVYDTGILEYANQSNDFGVIIFILLLGGGIFIPEYRKTSSGAMTMSIIRTTKYGRHRFIITKLLLVIFSALTATMISNATEIYCFLQNYDTRAFNAPIASIMEYGNMPGWLTVGCYFIMMTILSIIGTVCLAVLAYFISCIGENIATVYGAIVLLMLLPYAASLVGMKMMSYIDLLRLADAQRLFSLITQKSPMWGVVYYAVLIIGTITTVAVVFAKTERKS